jgi:phage antirepressor YoqD-like protein
MSDLITTGGAPATMTSLELVDFINSQRGADEAELRHDDFMRKAPKVLGEGVRSFADTYVHPQNGQTYPCYRFPKREACLMAMSYSYDLQAKVFDRMTVLEEQARNPIAALSRVDLLKLALDSEEKRLALEARVQADAPKLEAYDRLVDADGLLNPTNAAKALQVEPNKVFKFMRTNRWVYRKPGARSDVAYQDKIEAGWLTHKTYVARREDGTDRLCEQVMVTPKGLTKLAERLAVKGH